MKLITRIATLFVVSTLMLSAVEVVNTSFESTEYNSGTVAGQNSWTIDNGTANIISTDAKTGSQSLQFNVSNSKLVTMYTPYSQTVDGPSGVIYFDVWVKINSMETKKFALCGYDLYSNSEKRAFVMEFNTPGSSSNVFQAYNGSSKSYVADYDLGTWNRLSARIDYNTGTYQVEFNGSESDLLSFRESYSFDRGDKQFHELRMNLGYDGAVGSVDAIMDDLYIGHDPIPGVSFDAVEYTWSIDVDEPDFGSIILDPDLGEYDDSTWVTARVDVPDGYKLVQWTGDLSGSDTIKTFQITSNMSIGADVAIDPLNPPPSYTIALYQPDHGTISLDPIQGSYYENTNVRASISVDAGYLFAGWTGDLSGTDMEKSFTIMNNMTIGASVVVDTIPPEVYTFSSGDAFKSKCRETDLRAGDIIELTDGSYDFGGITMRAKGSPGKPIIVRAQNTGGATLTGDSDFVLEECEYVTIEGFVFTSDTYTAIKLEACNNIHITKNNFRLTDSVNDNGKWILVTGVWDNQAKISHHNTIDYNTFEDKLGPGNYITIDGGDVVSQHDKIRYNYFKSIGPRIDNEMEAIRVGVSGMSYTPGYTLIEYNLFEDCDGDPEIVSIKSCYDTLRYNTFIECQGTVCFRQGDGSVADGNFIFGNGKEGTGGFRMYSRDHIFVNNHIQDITGDVWDAGFTLTNGDKVSGTESAHWQIQNVLIANNTLVNVKAPFEIGYAKADGSWSKAPTNVRIAGNIIYGSDNPAIVYKSGTTPSNFTWTKNIYWDTDALTPGESLTENQLKVSDPNIENSAGYYKPVYGGLAHGFLTALEWDTDIQGIARPQTNDAGASLYGTPGIAVNRPLTVADVGPNAAPIVITAIDDVNDPIAIPKDFNATCFPNPFNGNLSVKFELENTAELDINVYLVNGQHVASLANKAFNAGSHTLRWIPENNTSGLYLISIKGQNKSQVIKALYLK